MLRSLMVISLALPSLWALPPSPVIFHAFGP